MTKALSKILAVDADESALQIIENVLNEDYSIETATDGEMAIGKLKSSPFDLVLSDLKMPKMNGTMFVDTARRRNCI